ncbi:MAG: hypothetical protein GY720_10830 [bacterium]|nr:hypothetical protein [bacterium]
MRRIFPAVVLVSSLFLVIPAAVATGGSHQCDFDGDGFDDAAIGVSREDVGAALQAGAVNVIYGLAEKLASTGNQLWTQDSAGVAGAAEDGDLFGLSIECGDFNGDGYADLVVGSPGEAVGTTEQAGALHLLFGSASGLVSGASQFLHRDVAGVAGRARFGDRWAWALAAGDFNGDGRDDLAVGAYGDDVGGISNAGSVQVFHGSGGGLSTSDDKIWHRGTSGVKGDLRQSALFGRSLATGDFDGNGYDDLAIGARDDTVDGLYAAGSVSVLYGASTGLQKAGDDLLHRNTAGIGGSPQVSDRFGHALAAGDFNADGYDELAIGVPFDDFGGAVDSGSVHVLRGGPDGLKTGGDKIWHRDTDGIRGTARDDDGFGWSLATGRFDDGGHYDLAIGTYLDDVGGVADTGSVHVIYGSGSGLAGTGDQIWHQDRKGIKGTNDAGDLMGWSVATGDFDGNGNDDLLISVGREDVGAISGAGRVSVIYGKADRLRAGGDQSWSQNSPGIGGIAEVGDGFGENVNGSAN